MKSFYQAQAKGLVYLPEVGIGHYPVPISRPYDEKYFDNYQKLAATTMGKELTASRIRLVGRHYEGLLIDVGIGAGQFVEARPNTRGYDVNPAGIHWLKSRGLWSELYCDRYPALSFWDSLEHIDRPDLAVAHAEEWVFISVPIFDNAEHIIQSHHFRKDEHIWYFTDYGIKRWFDEQGFACVEQNTVESQLGRSGIGTYAFKRKTRA